MKQLARFGIGIMGICAVASAAAAETITVFPLAASKLPATASHLPASFDAAIASTVSGSLSGIPIEDAAALLDCDPETTRCLEAVAKKSGAAQLVFGTIATGANGALVVTLTRFAPGEREQRTIRITASTDVDRRAQLIKAITPMFSADEVIEAPKAPVQIVEDEDEDDVAPALAVTPAPRDVNGPRDVQHARTGSWIAITSGLAVAAGGGAVVWSTRALRADIAAAPVGTRAEIDRLLELEEREQMRTRIGYGLVALGGAVTIAGVVHAIVTKRPRKQTGLALQPLDRGAALTFTGRLP